MKRRRISRGGFTLLEVLLVVAILGVIAAMVVPQLLGRQKQAMIDATKTSIKALESAVKFYAVAHDGEFPQGGQDVINSLMEAEEQNGKLVDPYLEELPTDAWGQVLNYEHPNTKDSNTTKPAIWSNGPDRKNDEGSGDDINNWTRPEQQ
jgi:general secretion pathway protein G